LDNLNLRKADSSDSKLIFEWANDFEMRMNSFSVSAIEWSEHEKWFDKKLKDINRNTIFILELFDKPIGQIRFDRKTDKCFIDYFIIKEERGKGYGKIIICKGLEKIKSIWPDIVFINAEVKKENIASNKVFEELKFKRICCLDHFLYQIEI
jgi:RimJ/RimL family protein N-acetyltransferase